MNYNFKISNFTGYTILKGLKKLDFKKLHKPI